jgi:hypothetical protein
MKCDEAEHCELLIEIKTKLEGFDEKLIRMQNYFDQLFRAVYIGNGKPAMNLQIEDLKKDMDIVKSDVSSIHLRYQSKITHISVAIIGILSTVAAYWLKDRLLGK